MGLLDEHVVCVRIFILEFEVWAMFGVVSWHRFARQVKESLVGVTLKLHQHTQCIINKPKASEQDTQVHAEYWTQQRAEC